ncbi:MAG: DNA polymerase III subunit alpha [Gammaproteobacteria bacterium]|nr:DNA polymerase III subunit alpha [Gammaproteobacteria bacterium]
MTQSFIHLRLHTDASLVDGLVQLKPLISKTVKEGMAAVAITDLNNFFNLVKFQKTAHGAGVKPIYGCDIELDYTAADGSNYIGGATLLAQSLDGYRQITVWLSKAYTENQKLGKPVVKWNWLAQDITDGVIFLTGGTRGVHGKALKDGNPVAAEGFLQDVKQKFSDRAYIELNRTGREGENEYIAQACQLATQLDLPVVATNAVRFLEADDFDVHEIRCAIHSGHVLDDPKRPKPYTSEQHFKSAAEMVELFSDIPSAIQNTVEIAKRCNTYIPLGTNFLPDFQPPEGMTLDEFFRKRSQDGLEERFQKLFGSSLTQEQRDIYQARLDEEIGIIIQMGFPGYFLIVMDFIQWAKNNGVPVGPGRGSGAGSLVAYVLGITDLDPIKYDLLFERFLNPERVSMPDFDVDFCMDGRDRVIEYVANHYGRNAVSQIITFGTMAAKAVIRDVGRVLGRPYPVVDRISKMVPFEVGMTLTKAMEQEEAMQAAYHNDEDVKEILDMALKLEGMKRNVGKHAGGVVIAPSKLTDFVPLYCDDEGNNLVTQFDKDDVEQAGLVKFDFLGLRTLTIVDWALKNIKKRYGDDPQHQIDIELLPLDDKKTFDLLQAYETTAVFQLESRGMKDLIKRLQPSCFEDIIALVALFRPGPLQSGMVDDFIDRKHGRAEVEYPHPDLEPVLANTYGVILYQEQVMQIAQVLADFTLGGADMLRRAMGKKKPEEMDKMRKLFVEGASKKGIDPELSGSIFDLMEKFAGYGFNKSHSAAYALVSYHTAWLKAHYPSEFMAAVLSADMHNTDKVVTLIEECRIMGLTVKPPHIHYSDYAFTVSDTGEIIYGLGAIKGLGEGPIEEIVQHRGTTFKDIYNFCTTVDSRKFNKKSLEALIKSGAMDGLGPHRASMLANMERAMTAANQERQREAQGMMDLFGALEMEEDSPAVEWIEADNWSMRQGLKFEKDTLGLYLSGHPLDVYESEIKSLVNMKISDLRPTEKGKPAKIAGIVVGIRIMRNKKGKKIAFVTIDDRTGRMDISFFSDKYEEHAELIQVDKLLMIEGDVTFDDYSGQCKMSAKQLVDLDLLRQEQLKKVTLRGNLGELGAQEAEWIARLVQQHAGGQVLLEMKLAFEDQPVVLQLEDQRVVISEQLLEALERIWGRDKVELHY